MGYTVKKLSELSGVSVRALHFYEKEGLLKPAYYGSNGYRYYEKNELLRLQQILFYKELGFSLSQICKVLGKSNFDQLSALYSHRRSLIQEVEKVKSLIKSIDKTIRHLKGRIKMKEEDVHSDILNKENQIFTERGRHIHTWTKTDLEQYKQDSEANFKELSLLKEKHLAPNSEEVQEIIHNLYQWVHKFWTPDKESFIRLGQMYTDLEWKKFFEKYDPHHPQLALFIAEGMRFFADTHLS